MSLTSGSVVSSNFVFNSSEVSQQVVVNGNAIGSYQQTFRVYNPAGYFSVPMPGRMALVTPTPYGNTGYTMGFANEAPATNNNVSDLVAGESAISETSGFNFNIKAKIDKLLSTFTNGDSQIINTNLPIGENIVTILTDIIAEIVALESAVNNMVTIFNTHIHPAPGGNTGAPTMPQSSYTATTDFTNDKTFINQDPSQMYINTDGHLIT